MEQGPAHLVQPGIPYMVKGHVRVSDGKSWRCEHNRWPSECKHCVAARKGVTIAPYGKEVWAAKQQQRYGTDTWDQNSSYAISAVVPLGLKRTWDTANSAAADESSALASAAVRLFWCSQ